MMTPVIALLVAQLKEPNRERQMEAIRRLADLAEGALPAHADLIQLYGQADDDDLADAALAASKRIGLGRNEAFCDSFYAYHSRFREVQNFFRDYAIRTSTSIRSARDLLFRFLEYKGSDLLKGDWWYECYKAVKEIIHRYPSLFPYLYQAFVNEKPEDRTWLGMAIADLVPTHPPALESLIYTAGEDDPSLRASAIEALCRLENRLNPVIPRLLDLFEKHHRQMEASEWHHCKKLAHHAFGMGEVIIERLRDAGPRLRTSLVELLHEWITSHSEDPTVREIVLRAFRDEEESVREGILAAQTKPRKPAENFS